MELLCQGLKHIQVLTSGRRESGEQSFGGGQHCWWMMKKITCPGLAVFLLFFPRPFYNHLDKHVKMLP